MARLEGQKTKPGAIIIGAVIISLVAAGLFLAFRPASGPADIPATNSAPAENSSSESGVDNGVSTEATPIVSGSSPTPLASETAAPDAGSEAANTPNVQNEANNSQSNASTGETPTSEAQSAPLPIATSAPTASSAVQTAPSPVAPNSVTSSATPAASPVPTASSSKVIAPRSDEPRSLAPIPRSTPVRIENPNAPASNVPAPVSGY